WRLWSPATAWSAWRCPVVRRPPDRGVPLAATVTPDRRARRDFFITHVGPGLLGGLTLGDWLRLLAENRFAVAPSRALRALTLPFHSAPNSGFRLVDQLRPGAALENLAVPPPLFILGHWRNGTTHLHHLLSVDDRFAFPSTYEVLFPHTFLTTEAINS